MRILALLMLCLLTLPAQAADTVDVALVLVADVSRSIDDSEFQLQKQGYATAFTDPKVLAAITSGMAGAISVAYVEFAGDGEVRTVIDWTTVRDAASAAQLAARLQAAPRSFWGHTSISAGVDQAMRLLNDPDGQAPRKVIDVSGDGTNNSGRDARARRRRGRRRHHQRARHHQRPSRVLSVRPCAAAGRPRQLVPAERDRWNRKLRRRGP